MAAHLLRMRGVRAGTALQPAAQLSVRLLGPQQLLRPCSSWLL